MISAINGVDAPLGPPTLHGTRSSVISRFRRVFVPRQRPPAPTSTSSRAVWRDCRSKFGNRRISASAGSDLRLRGRSGPARSQECAACGSPDGCRPITCSRCARLRIATASAWPTSGRFWPEMAGGKAHTLAEMQRAGFCVPQFVCSPPDLEQAFHALDATRRSVVSERRGRWPRLLCRSFSQLFEPAIVRAGRACS